MRQMDRAALDGVELEYEVRVVGEPVVLAHHSAGADWFNPLAQRPDEHAEREGLRMRRGSRGVVTAVVVAIACGCEAPLTYKQPPVGSYTAEAHQMKIGEAVTSVQGATVTLDFFGAAEIRPLLGRFFTEADRASSTSVVVLSHDLWAERFGSSPSIIGREIELDGHQTTVVGVVPRGFRFPEGTLLWTSR